MTHDRGLTYPLELLQEIGRGGLGVVYLAYHHRLQKHVVVKKVASTSMRKGDLRIEVDLLKNLHHSYLPHVYDFIQTSEGAYTVMEYVEGESLAKYISGGMRPDQAQLVEWMLQLCEVLAYLHGQNPSIIHSDIKPENILVTTSGNICLIDFNITPTASSSQVLGLSIHYASPEQRWLAHREYGYPDPYIEALGKDYRRITPASDIYSLGASFHSLVLGYQSHEPVLPLPKLSEYDLPYQEAFLHVLDKAVRLDQRERYQSAVELREALVRRERSDTQYRRNRNKQVLVGFASTLMLVGGIVLVALGVTALQYQAFEEAYSEFGYVVQSGDNQAVVNTGMALLNDINYAGILDESSEDRANILRAMGDAKLREQATGDAVVYLSQALDAMKGNQGVDDYYRDYVVALAKDSRFEDAEEVIDEANALGVSSEQMDLAWAQISWLKGDEQAALEAADELVATTVDPELTASAELLRADIYMAKGDWKNCAKALEAANGADPTSQTQRRLADVYLQRATSASSTNEGSNHYTAARDLLEPLCSLPSPSVLDRLNYATALRALGDTAAAEKTLNQLAQESSGDYRVALQQALLYEQTGNKQQAKKYCEQALNQIATTSISNNKDSNKELLLALEKRLG